MSGFAASGWIYAAIVGLACSVAGNSALLPAPQPVVIYGRNAPIDPALYVPIRQSAALGCRGGNQDLCIQLAEMMKRGLGGPKQPHEARLLLRNACRSGYTRVCDGAMKNVR